MTFRIRCQTGFVAFWVVQMHKMTKQISLPPGRDVTFIKNTIF